MKEEITRAMAMVIKSFAVAVVAISLAYSVCMVVRTTHSFKTRTEVVRDTVYLDSEWSKMIGALIKVESNGKADAVNEKTGATGVLQITDIYLADANRILKEERYTPEDRKDPYKSVEMFNIVQGHYNPSRDIDKAIRMHNPTAGNWYYERVKKAMI